MVNDRYNPLYAKELRSAADWHISFVYNDPSFNKTLAVVREMDRRANFIPSKRTQSAKQKLADRYGIEVEDVNVALLPLYIENRKRMTKLKYDGENEEWIIKLHRKTTKAELLEAFAEFKQQMKLLGIKSPTTRRKPPENPQLLYAMFNERKLEKRFSEIFQDYEGGTLSGYDGSKTQFKTEDSLERYYHQHYPSDKPAA